MKPRGFRKHCWTYSAQCSCRMPGRKDVGQSRVATNQARFAICTLSGCALWPFRMGRDPHPSGKRSGAAAPHRAMILDGTGNSRTLVDRYGTKPVASCLYVRDSHIPWPISPLAWLSAPAGFPSRRSPANGARPHDRASSFCRTRPLLPRPRQGLVCTRTRKSTKSYKRVEPLTVDSIGPKTKGRGSMVCSGRKARRLLSGPARPYLKVNGRRSSACASSCLTTNGCFLLSQATILLEAGHDGRRSGQFCARSDGFGGGPGTAARSPGYRSTWCGLWIGRCPSLF